MSNINHMFHNIGLSVDPMQYFARYWPPRRLQ